MSCLPFSSLFAYIFWLLFVLLWHLCFSPSSNDYWLSYPPDIDIRPHKYSDNRVNTSIRTASGLWMGLNLFRCTILYFRDGREVNCILRIYVNMFSLFRLLSILAHVHPAQDKRLRSHNNIPPVQRSIFNLPHCTLSHPSTSFSFESSHLFISICSSSDL